ncbi:MAG: hypothetical protein KGM99_17505 [Burkholderiales bacterium]|nr:hypothetical protein [Burkholderiales bacterium]
MHPVIPPNVEYCRTALGHSLGKEVCAIWNWVEVHARQMQVAQQQFDAR